MRNRRRPERRVENPEEVNSILKYFKRDVLLEAKGRWSGVEDEALADLILEGFMPKYKDYNYTISVDEEFKAENPVAKAVIFGYLVAECKGCFDQKQCLNRHFGQNRRRVPQRLFNGLWTYLPKLCSVGNCEEHCEFAHSQEEVNYHPMVYKTKPCPYPVVNHCCSELGRFCYNAHDDLRSPSLSCVVVPLTSAVDADDEENEDVFALDTFKISQCKLKGEHNKSYCNYFHDLKDKRRDPNKFSYTAQQCSSGFNKDFKCRFRDACKFSHNDVEVLYHKDVYRVRQCKDKPCEMGDKCPYLHSKKEKDKGNLQDSINNLKAANETINKELQEMMLKKKELEIFICTYCNIEIADIILPCGHLVCKGCASGDSCTICFVHMHPMTEIKFL